MNHPSDDELLLFAYGEADQHQEHLAGCAECRARLAMIEEGRTILDLGTESPARPARLRALRALWLGLPLAAGIGALLLWPKNQAPTEPSWHSTVSSSAAGYVTGGQLMALDSQLTRLEQGASYGTLIQD